MELLLKFEYGNKWYGVVKDGDKIKNYVIKRDNYDFSLSKEENKLINAVLDNFIPSDKRINLMDYEYGGKNYQVFLDPKTNIRHFSPRPNDIDLYELNMIFNNMDECFYDDGQDQEEYKKEPKLIKRIVTFGKRFIIAFVSVSVLSAGLVYTSDLYADKKAEENTAYTQSLSVDEIQNIAKNAVLTNKKLTDEEKEKVLSFLSSEIFEDNQKYMDIIYLEDVLHGIDIKYHHGISRAEGSYNYVLNIINFFGVNDLTEVDDVTFAHELYHALQKYNLLGDYNFLIETTNTIFNDEYGSKETSLYNEYYNFTKALMEIVGAEPLQHYHSYTSVDFIVDELASITGTRTDAIKLLANLENYANLYKRWRYHGTATQPENLIQLRDTIVGAISEYYYAKYNISIDNDLVMLYYLKPDEFNNILTDMYKLEFGEVFTIQNNRTYFKNSDDSSIRVYASKVYSYSEKWDSRVIKNYSYDSGKVTISNSSRKYIDDEWVTDTVTVDMTQEELDSQKFILEINDNNRYTNTSNERTI